jgi:hypothetical protein
MLCAKRAIPQCQKKLQTQLWPFRAAVALQQLLVGPRCILMLDAERQIQARELNSVQQMKFLQLARPVIVGPQRSTLKLRCGHQTAYCPAEGRNTCGSERAHVLAVIFAKLLYRAGRAVADAIDWKKHNIGSSHQVAKHSRRVFDSTIMMEQCTVMVRDPLPEFTNGLGSSADIKYAAATQIAQLARIALKQIGVVV